VAALYAHQAGPRSWRDGELALMREVAERTWEAAGRARAEAALRASEARLQAAVDLVGLSPYSWDPATGVHEWDARLKAMWGLPPDAHVDGDVFRAGIHPEDRPRVEAAIATCIDPAGDGVYALEYRVVGIGDGVERWVATHGRTFFEDGRPVGFVGVALDITGRKRAEAALRASEARYRAVFEQAAVGIERVDLRDGRILEANDALCGLLGYEAAELRGRNAAEIIHPDDLPAVRERIGALLAGTVNSYAIEKRYLTRAGASVWVRVTSSVAEGLPAGEAYRVSIIEDIDERKRAEAALRESEERFRLFAEHSTNVLWTVDTESGLIEYLSPAYERVWGAPSAALLGEHWRRWAETVHPDDRGRAVDAMERALRGETVAQEYRIVRPDGAVRWLRDALFPIRDERGRVRRAGGIAQDVTAHEGSLVYLVDGGEASRRELALLLQGSGYQVKAFASVQGFLEMAPALLAGCVLIDVRAPAAGGLAVPRELRARRIALPVIVAGDGAGDPGLGVRAMKAGAVDFLETPFRREPLLAAVAGALAGIREEAEEVQAAALAAARVAGLSVREREVLEGLLAGGTNKTVGQALGISPRTVEVHRAHVMERLGARTLPEAVLVAAAAGLRPPRSGEGT